ncbi:MAG: beta strand repeat-containing protein, partial [Stellaceae bacterium]
MAGTIYSGTYLNGIVLSSPTTQLPATIAATGYVTNTSMLHNGDAVYGALGTAWTLANLGTIHSGDIGDGVQLESGGYVANSGSISSSSRSVEIDNAAGTIVNSGVITGNTGLYLRAGGIVTNTGTILSNSLAIQSGTPGSVTITNLGTVSTSDGTGISLADGGTLVNGGAGATGARITTYLAALDASGAPGTVTNYGTIRSLGVDTPAGVYLRAGGSVTNRSGALISAQTDAVQIDGDGTVTNFGTIESVGIYGYSAAVALGGSGYDAPPVGDSTLTNAGTISGAHGTAVVFYGGNNQVILDPGASFAGIVKGGTGSDTLELAAGTGTGTLSGFGTNFVGFSDVGVDDGATWQLASANTLSAGTALSDNGTLANTGALTVAAAGALFVFGSLINSGSIAGTVTLNPIGFTNAYLDNQATGVITSAGIAVHGYGSPSTVINAGTISGTGDAGIGVYLAGIGSTLTNAGTISGASGTAVAFG